MLQDRQEILFKSPREGLHPGRHLLIRLGQLGLGPPLFTPKIRHKENLGFVLGAFNLFFRGDL